MNRSASRPIVSSALEMGKRAEVALVDLNLRDGATGIEIGRELASRHDVTVVFMTANPTQLGDGVPGTLGVIAKPVADSELRDAIRYAVACHNEHMDAEPPARLQLFMTPGGEPGAGRTVDASPLPVKSLPSNLPEAPYTPRRNLAARDRAQREP